MQKDDSQPGGASKEPETGLPISPIWEARAERLIRKMAKGKFREPEHFAGKVFRKQFFPILSRVYFDELVAYAESNHRLDKVAIAEHLGLNASTLTRWLNRKNPPGADKFFAIVILVLKKSLHDIPFPDRNAILFRAVAEQLKSFTLRYLATPGYEINRLAFRCLIHAMKDRSSDRLLPGLKSVSAEDREKALKRATTVVNRGLQCDCDVWNRRNPTKIVNSPMVSPSQLAQWLTDWGMAYTLLAYGTKSVAWGLNDDKIGE